MMSKWITRFSLVATASLVACGGTQEQTATTTAAPPAATPAAATPAVSEEDAPATDYKVAPVTDGGWLEGKVTFTAPPPTATTVEVTKDNEVCHEEKKILNVKVDAAGGLSEAVVWIDGIKEGKDWASADGAIDQKDCEYTPHVQAMPAGGKLAIMNSDPLLHNIHGTFAGESLFNVAQPAGAPSIPKKLKNIGPVELKCDVHSWMKAWVFVAPHPYFAVTAVDGSFAIKDVAPGTYTVKVWHEELGEQEMQVTVTAAAAAATNFSYPKM